jgi:hypothetical protein
VLPGEREIVEAVLDAERAPVQGAEVFA